MVLSLAKGAWLGFCIAAPVGPIGILVLKQALQWGRWSGLASGLGAALADLIYGCLAIGGVRLMAGYGREVRIAGGVVLLALAWRLWMEKPAAETAPNNARGSWRGVATTFGLTLANPMTILSFTAMIAGTAPDSPVYFVGGVFLGSMLWWTILCLTAGWLKKWLTLRGALLNRLSALTLGSFGVWAIWAGG